MCRHFLNYAADIGNSCFVQLPLFVTFKKVYDRNVVNKYIIYLLLGAMSFNLIDYIYMYVRV